MCGIAGLIRRQGAGPELARTVALMTAALAHRGPDDGGLWADPAAGVGLGHRRLAILDLSPAGPAADGLGERPAGAHLQRRDLQLPRAAPRARGARRAAFAAAATARCCSRRSSASASRARSRGSPGCSPSRSGTARQRRLHARARPPRHQAALLDARRAASWPSPRSSAALLARPHWSPAIDRDALAAYLRWNYVPAPCAIFAGVRKLRARRTC